MMGIKDDLNQLLTADIADAIDAIAEQQQRRPHLVLRDLLRQALAARDNGSLYVHLDREMLADVEAIATAEKRSVQATARAWIKYGIRCAKKTAAKLSQTRQVANTPLPATGGEGYQLSRLPWLATGIAS